MKKFSLIVALFYTLSLFSATTVFADTNAAPSVSITGLSNGTEVSMADKLTISAQVTDDTSVADVKLCINGETVAENPTPAGDVYTFSDITLNNIGDVKVEVIATDGDGVSGTDAVILTAVKSTDVTLVSLDFEDGNKTIDGTEEGIGKVSYKIGEVQTESETVTDNKVLICKGAAGNGMIQMTPQTAGTEGKFVFSTKFMYTSGAIIKFQFGRSEPVQFIPEKNSISHGANYTDYADEWHSMKFVLDTNAALYWFYLDDTLLSSEDGTAYTFPMTEVRPQIAGLEDDSDYVMFDDIYFAKVAQAPYPVSVQQNENSFEVTMSDSVVANTLTGNIDIYYGSNNEKYELESISYDDTTKKITITPTTPVISSLEHKIQIGENIGTSMFPVTGVKSVKYFTTQSVDSDVCDFAFVKSGDTVGSTATIQNTTSEPIVVSMVMVLIDSDGAVDKNGVYIDTVTVPAGDSQVTSISPVALDGNTVEVFFIDDSYKSFKNYIYK